MVTVTYMLAETGQVVHQRSASIVPPMSGTVAFEDKPGLLFAVCGIHQRISTAGDETNIVYLAPAGGKS